MSDDQSLSGKTVQYIETPRRPCRPEKIDVLLERRMKEFLLERRRRIWREASE